MIDASPENLASRVHSMASSTLANLLARAGIDDHDEILKEADKAIKHDSNDAEAQRAKVVALLKLEHYEGALKALEAGGSGLEQSCQFEKAYALYKAGNLEDARKTSKSAADHRGAKHVEAQSVRLEIVGFVACTLTNSHSYTGKRGSVTLPPYIKHYPGTTRREETRRMIYESILGQLKPNFNGYSLDKPFPRSLQGKTWMHSRHRSMQHAGQ